MSKDLYQKLNHGEVYLAGRFIRFLLLQVSVGDISVELLESINIVEMSRLNRSNITISVDTIALAMILRAFYASCGLRLVNM